MFKTLLAGLLLVATTALANPLLSPDFWATATPESLRQAVRGGADLNARSQTGLTPLHVAAANNTNPEIIRTLVELGADLNARAQRGETPLHVAAGFNQTSEVVLVLLELGADHRARDSAGSSAWDLIQENEQLKTPQPTGG